MDITPTGSVPNPDTSLEPIEYFNGADGALFTLDGPMARAYTEALDELYKKETGPDGLTLESISLTDGYQNSMAWKDGNWLKAARGGLTQTNSLSSLGMIYGVKKSCLELAHFQALTRAIGQMTRDQRMNSAVILDQSEPDSSLPKNQTNWVTEAYATLIQRYCERGAPRISVYPSLQAFIKARR